MERKRDETDMACKANERSILDKPPPPTQATKACELAINATKH